MKTKRDISGWTIRWDAERAARLVDQGAWPNRTIADYAKDCVDRHPNRVQMIDPDRQLTCAEAYTEARCLAAWMLSAGFKQGQTVSFQLPNWWEAGLITLASAMIGVVINPIVPIYRDAELVHILNQSRSRAIFVPASFRKLDYVAMMHRIMPQLDSPIPIVAVRGEAVGALSYSKISATAPDREDWPTVDPDAVKLIMFTSGTTGPAKGVLHTHNTLNAESYQVSRRLRLGADDVVFNPAPVTHVGGLARGLNLPWYADIPAVQMAIWEPEQAFDLLNDHRCTSAGGAIPFLQGLIAVSDRRGEILPHLRYYACGSAAVPPELIYAARRIMPNCLGYRVFGSTEVPTITVAPEGTDAKAIRRGAETDGRIGLAEVKIVDAITGITLPEGVEGEILARSPTMAVGYVAFGDNVASYDADGFFRTGDLGRIVDCDHIVVTGRMKDIIIRSGENVSPKEIEDVLAAHPRVAEVAVVSMPSPTTGEAICAFIVSRDGLSLDIEDVAQFVANAGLARQKTPERVAMIESLPRNPAGKVRKDMLRQTARGFAT